MKRINQLYLLILTILLSCCDWNNSIFFVNKNPQTAPWHKNNLIIGNGAEPETLDPQKASGVPEGQILKDIFEGLTSVGDNGLTGPAVAKSWETKDNQTWLFHLRNNAKWSNGAPVTAHDFVFAWQRLVDPKTASVYASYLSDLYMKNAQEIIEGKKPVSSLGVKALDNFTLEVTLTQPVPYLPEALTHSSVLPVYQPIVEKYGKKWTHAGHMISNGAYYLKSWYVNNRIIVVKNPYYWDHQNTRIQQVEYLPITQPITDVITFMSGREDITYNILPPELFSKLKQEYSQELIQTPQLCIYYYDINIKRKPFDDVRVRRALNLVIDRNMLTDKVLKQGQKPSYSLTPYYTANFTYIEPEWAHWSEEKKIKEAKKLLNEAGYNEKHPLKFEILYNTLGFHKTVALTVASEWKTKLGFVEAVLVNQEWKSYLDAQRLANFDMVRKGWCGDYNEASAFLNIFKSGNSNNHIKYSNQKYDQLLQKVLERGTTAKQRQQLYIEAEKVLMDDAVSIILFTIVAPRLVKAYVEGYSTKDPTNFIHTKNIKLKYRRNDKN